MTPPLVVDASAVVALLIDPSAVADRIGRRLRGAELHAPSHLPVEVTNVLRRRHHAGLLGASESGLALDGLWALPIQLWPFEVLRWRVWELGANLSSYDAAYVALAERLGATLLTQDARLSRGTGVRCAIELTT